MKRIFGITLISMIFAYSVAYAAAASGVKAAVTGAAGNFKSMGAMGKVTTVGGIAGGAYGIYDSVSGQGEHGIGDLAEGVGGGIALGMAAGTLLGGPGIGTAIGAGIGLLAAGSQLFSETDCLYDPITKKFTCCNTAFNQGERQVPIGGFMFCGDDKGENTYPPAVRQCLQGGSDKPASFFSGLLKDDAWAPECVKRLCSGEIERTADARGKWVPDVDNFCWRWQSDSRAAAAGGARGAGTANASDDAVLYDKLISGIEREINALQVQCGANLK